MTTAVNIPLLGASSKAVQWNAINWHSIKRQVQRLQKRIAKATRNAVSSHRVQSTGLGKA